MTAAVSVILPTFDRVEYLPATVASVFAQTFPDWELLIADDGSHADTRSYLRSLAEQPKVKVIWLPHSGKPSVARNAALREARGEYVAFLDSDDVWLPGKLEAQITSLRCHEARKWSYTTFDFVDAAGDPLPSPADRRHALSGWVLEKLLAGETLIALPSVMMSRSFLERLGPFDEHLVMCEDDELWFRAAAESEIEGVDAPLTLVRRHQRHSGSDVIAWRDRGRVFEKLLRAAHDGRLDPVLRKLRAQMSAGLARSQAVSGDRTGAFATVLRSAPHTWRYPKDWLGALAAIARSSVPANVRSFVRRYLPRQGGHNS
jgi:glycosyltransferase involved in cell wall biosynthesis